MLQLRPIRSTVSSLSLRSADGVSGCLTHLFLHVVGPAGLEVFRSLTISSLFHFFLHALQTLLIHFISHFGACWMSCVCFFKSTFSPNRQPTLSALLSRICLNKHRSCIPCMKWHYHMTLLAALLHCPSHMWDPPFSLATCVNV